MVELRYIVNQLGGSSRLENILDFLLLLVRNILEVFVKEVWSIHSEN